MNHEFITLKCQKAEPGRLTDILQFKIDLHFSFPPLYVKWAYFTVIPPSFIFRPLSHIFLYTSIPSFITSESHPSTLFPVFYYVN